MLRFDCHTHSYFSDGKGSVLQNVEAARAAGLDGLCLTDHLTLPHAIDPACEVSVPEERLPEYAKAVEEARAAVPEVELVYGFEADYYPGCEANVLRWSRGSTFLLGSVHLVDGRWIDDPNDQGIWQDLGTDEVWRRYFDIWCEACHSRCGFSSMAHPDLVSLFGFIAGDALRRACFAKAAETARDAGVHVEINTAGANKPVGRFYPEPELLKAFCSAGVPLTVGSDAHMPSRVGEGLDEARKLAYGVGYRSVDVPRADGSWTKAVL